VTAAGTRRVTLHLVDADGRPLGALPPYEVESPWWQETGPAVERAAELYGVVVMILHLLGGVPRAPGYPTSGGRVSYLAELLSDPAYVPLAAPSDEEPEPDDPRRPVWARPGGTARIVAWADDVLSRLGRSRLHPAVQVRAWNLSSILRLDTATGPVWCKTVPDFFGHEGRAIARLGRLAPDGLLPVLLGYDEATHSVLLDDVPGRDLYDCPEELAHRMVDRLIELQVRTVPEVNTLPAIGLPDWRSDAFTAAAGELVEHDGAGPVTVRVTAGVRARPVPNTADRLGILASCPVRCRSSDRRVLCAPERAGCFVVDVAEFGDGRPDAPSGVG
jgi:hypothetical protein